MPDVSSRPAPAPTSRRFEGLGRLLFYGSLLITLTLLAAPAFAQSTTQADGLYALRSTLFHPDGEDDDAGAGTLVGTVTDSVSGDPLPGANVALVENQAGTATGPKGRFRLSGIAPGTYTLQVTYLGYERQRAHVKIVPGDKTRHLTRLAPEQLEMDELRVSAESERQRASRNIGVSRMSMEEITKMPTAFTADVFRALQKLPGVSSSSDFSSGLYIRGGSPAQTLVELDGATIYNPSHFLGFFSTFNPSAVDGATLHKGAYGAEHGGRLGSVLQLSHRRPGARPGGNLRLGLLSSRASVHGPHPWGSWLLTARRSTMEPILAELNERNVDGVPEAFRFYDLNARARFDLSSGRIDASYYQGHDRMDFPFAANMVFDLAYGNRTGALSWTRWSGDRLWTRVRLTGSTYASDSRASLTRAPFGRENRIRDLGASAETEYRLGEAHTLKGGLEATTYRFEILDTHNHQVELDRTKQPMETAAYFQETFSPSARWEIEAGLRGTYFAYEGTDGYARLAPRLSAEYRPTEAVRLQLGAGRYHQFLGLDHASILSSFHTWLPAGKGVKPAWGDQLTGGIKTDLTETIRLDLEGYVRTMKNLFELDPRRGDGRGRPYGTLFHMGEGLAFGVETLLEKRAGRISGHLGYTWGKTGRRFPDMNGGRWFPTTYDRRHDLTLALQVRIAEGWSLSASGKYASGQAYTKPTSQYILYDSPYMGHLHDIFRAPRNNGRLPAYRRVDLGLTRSGTLFGTADYALTLQVVNAFSHRNPWFTVYGYDNRYNITEQETPQIPVPLPSISFRTSF